MECWEMTAFKETNFAWNVFSQKKSHNLSFFGQKFVSQQNLEMRSNLDSFLVINQAREIVRIFISRLTEKKCDVLKAFNRGMKKKMLRRSVQFSTRRGLISGWFTLTVFMADAPKTILSSPPKGTSEISPPFLHWYYQLGLRKRAVWEICEGGKGHHSSNDHTLTTSGWNKDF